MRLVIDTLIAVMLVAILGGILVMHGQRKQGERDLLDTQQALTRLQEQTAYQSTVQSAIAGHQQVLVQIEPSWFGEYMPVNLLASADRPWLDLAPPGDLSDHPPDPIALDRSQAAFWYNPTRGIFRARVQPQLSEAQTLELYNKANGTQLLAFEPTPDPSRRPMAYVPGQAPTRQYASLATGWNRPAPTDIFDQPTATPEPAQSPAADPPAAAQPNGPIIIHDVQDTPVQPEPQPADDDTDSSPESTTPQPAEPEQDQPAPARPTLRK